MNFIRTAFIAQVCVLSLLQVGCGSDTNDNPASEHEESQVDEATQDEEANGESDLDQDQADSSDSEDEAAPGDETDPGEETEPEPESPWIAEEDLNAMKVGDAYRLDLQSNATTGYQWALQSGMDESVLLLESSRYVTPERAEGMTGGGGTEVFIFRAQGVGSTTVLLHYAQPWMPDDFASEFSFDVTVVE